MATLVSLRLAAAGYAPPAIGLVGAAYFAGLIAGSLTVGRVIRQVGHIRAFAAFVSVLTASTLAYAIHQSLPFWAALRLIDGLCVAGVYASLRLPALDFHTVFILAFFLYITMAFASVRRMLAED